MIIKLIEMGYNENTITRKISGASHPFSELEVCTYVGASQKGNLRILFPRYNYGGKTEDYYERQYGKE